MPETSGRSAAGEIVVFLAVVVLTSAAMFGLLDVVWYAGKTFHQVERNSAVVDSLASEARERGRQADNIDVRLKAAERRMDDMKKRLDGLATRADAISRKLDVLIERAAEK